jgi:hypothetical protein
MSRICLYYRAAPERDRWFPGDRLILGRCRTAQYAENAGSAKTDKVGVDGV